MAKRSRIGLGLIALLVVTLGLGGFLAKAQISAIMNKSPARYRPVQHAQEEVLAAFGLLEKAVHDGDATGFRQLLSAAARTSDGGPMAAVAGDSVPRPDVRLEPIAVCVRGDQAFVLARYDDPANRAAKSYLARYARENGAWKIADHAVSEAPPYRPAIHAFLPPEDGAFIHARRPWAAIASMDADGASAAARHSSWKVQATRDESFLYVRYANTQKLAAAARSAVPGDDRIPAVMISVTTPDDRQTLVRADFRIDVELGSGAAPLGEEPAKQEPASYALVVRDERGEMLFEGRPGAFNQLIGVHDHAVEIRIPLKSLGIHRHSLPEIELRDPSKPWQASPYRVARFSP